MRRALFTARVAVLALALDAGASICAAQKLPGGTVQPPAVRKSEVLRRASRTKLSSSPTSALLIVVTTPGAQLALDGTVIGTADADGQFEKEVRAGRHQLRVSSGRDFIPSERPVELAPRRREIVSVELESRFGALVLAVPRLEGVEVFVDSTLVARLDEHGASNGPSLGADGPSVTANRERSTVTLSHVESGTHTLRVTCSGCEPVEQSIALSGGQTQLVAVRSATAYVQVDVVSDPGTEVLLNGAKWGRIGPDGTFSGRAPAGEYVVRLERVGYEPVEQRRIFPPGESVRIEQRLSPALTTIGFGDDFELGLDRWEKPASGWSQTDGALVVTGPSDAGLARGIYYADFVFSFNVTLSSSGGAAWLVRARDSRNYYLFSLCGVQGRFPGRFATYIVTDGKFDVDKPEFTPIPVSTKLAAGEEYYVEITARGNRIESRITPLATGVPESLGEFVDPKALYPAGGIGFRALPGERFEIDDAYADPPEQR